VALGLAADRQAGTKQTPRQVRMLRAAEEQRQAFEQNLGLASPGAYAALAASRGQQALAKSQQDATNAYRTSDLGLRRDALTQQGTLATEREKGATERARLNAQAHVLGAGGDPSALGLSGPVAAGALPKAEQEFRAAAVEDPEKAVAMRISQGKTPEVARHEVETLNHSARRKSLSERLGVNYVMNEVDRLFGGRTYVTPSGKRVRVGRNGEVIPVQ
jgi:hypothetical protein